MKKMREALQCFKAAAPFKKAVAAGILLLCIAAVIIKPENQRMMVLMNQSTREIYLSEPIEVGDRIEYKWIHSFEHIPWVEEYCVTEKGHFLLQKISVAGFGAGIPENKGITKVENGMVVMDNIHEEFNEFRWFNSDTALSHISLNGKNVVRGSDLPHHEALELKTEERLSLCLRFQWIQL